MANSDIETLEISTDSTNKTQRSIWRRVLRLNPGRVVRQWPAIWVAKIRLRPKSRLPWVALLGPDGSGKTSVILKLETLFSPPLVSGVKILHRRPRLIVSSKKANDSPDSQVNHYAKPPHSLVKSAIKLGFFALDWLMGYWGQIVPQKTAGYLVILDRYYWLDLTLDPLRYRYNGPAWLPLFARRLLPSPDLVILLDAPAKVLQSRKQEVSPEESTRQRAAYLELIKKLPNSYVIDASNPLNQVVAEVQQIILDYITAYPVHSQLEPEEKTQ